MKSSNPAFLAPDEFAFSSGAIANPSVKRHLAVGWLTRFRQIVLVWLGSVTFGVLSCDQILFNQASGFGLVPRLFNGHVLFHKELIPLLRNIA